MDKSNGYEYVAERFIKTRGQTVNGIGSSAVRNWAQALPQGSIVLDLGSGTGIPISKVLTDEGMAVYGIDASATLVKAFRQNFPNAPFACEPVEESLFLIANLTLLSPGDDIPFIKRTTKHGNTKSSRRPASRR